jgi:SAM-dependent methyltransferase
VGGDADGVLAERRDGWEDEVAFWDHWLETRGFNWPEDYARKTNPRARVLIPRRFLPPEARRVTRFLPGRRPRLSILDVGSGPLSIVGTRLPGVDVELVPTDPLADRYRELLARHGVAAPVETRACAAESLADELGEERFDVVYCQNALDHSADPLAGLEQMTRAVKPGRWVVLKHTLDEGETEDYVGLHDWNFNLDRGRFVIWRPGERIHPDERLPLAARVEGEIVEEDGYRWVRVGILRR